MIGLLRDALKELPGSVELDLGELVDVVRACETLKHLELRTAAAVADTEEHHAELVVRMPEIT